MGETVDEWAATDDEKGNKKYRNLWDQELKVCEMQSEGRFMINKSVYLSLIDHMALILVYSLVYLYHMIRWSSRCIAWSISIREFSNNLHS